MLDHPSFWSGKLALRPRPYSRADSPIFRLYDGFKFSVFQRELLQEAVPNYEIQMRSKLRRSYVVKRLLFASFGGAPQRRARDRFHDIHIV